MVKARFTEEEFTREFEILNSEGDTMALVDVTYTEYCKVLNVEMYDVECQIEINSLQVFVDGDVIYVTPELESMVLELLTCDDIGCDLVLTDEELRGCGLLL